MVVAVVMVTGMVGGAAARGTLAGFLECAYCVRLSNWIMSHAAGVCFFTYGTPGNPLSGANTS